MNEAHSDALVIFGVTGDLAHKAIFPALYALVKSGALQVPVVGVASPKWSVEQLRARMENSVEQSPGGIDDKEAMRRLDDLTAYVSGDYNDVATFAKIKTALGGAQRPAHYLAIPPALFETVINGLKAAGVTENARVIVEKPFGRDLKSARELNGVARAAFPEDSIFRIDHYLGKEAITVTSVHRWSRSPARTSPTLSSALPRRRASPTWSSASRPARAGTFCCTARCSTASSPRFAMSPCRWSPCKS